MSWQPNEAGVQQIVALLTEFQSPGADQHKVLLHLDQCRTIPDFNNYLTYIFTTPSSISPSVRQGAGLLLKNNLRRDFPSLPPPLLSTIKSSILTALTLPDRALRHTAGTCIVTITSASLDQLSSIAYHQPETCSLTSIWPELVNALVQAFDRNDPGAIDGALDTVYKLYEEAPMAIEGGMQNHFTASANAQPNGASASPSKPVDVLLPRVLAQFNNPDASTRATAVSVFNQAATFFSLAFIEHLDSFIQGLFSLATDAAAPVRKAVCQGLVSMTELAPDRLQGNVQGVIEYMLGSTCDENADVAVQACEFWSVYTDSGLPLEALRGYLPRILPVLLKNMVYEEWDDEVEMAENAEEEALRGGGAATAVTSAEKDQDVKPSHIGGSRGGGFNDNEEEHDEDDDGDALGQWNLRKCSAAGLDVLSNAFRDELLPLLLPTVQARLAESDWRARESAILALGAVSEGCQGGLAAHLNDIIGAIMPGLVDARPMVRCIACWALMRYAKPLLDGILEEKNKGLSTASPTTSTPAQQIQSIVTGVCTRIATDHNWRVQGSACSALSSFIENAGDMSAASEFSSPILSSLGAALQTYSKRTMGQAYETLATIATHAPTMLRSQQAASLVVPRLYTALTPTTQAGAADGPSAMRDVLLALECLASIEPAIGPELQPYAEQLFSRLLEIVDIMRAAVAAAAVSDREEADEIVMAALDALTGMVEGLGAGIESLVGKSLLIEVVAGCCCDATGNPDVRLSAFALVGELARTCIPHLKGHLGTIVSAGLANLEPAAITQKGIGACNNAAWALGLIAVNLSSGEVEQFALPLLERTTRILNAPTGGLPKSLVENAAIALGRTAFSCPAPLAPHAGAFVSGLCSALRNARDGLEKEQAFLGLFKVLKLAPDAGAGAFGVLCEAVVSWKALPTELKRQVVEVMGGYRQQLIGMGQWEMALGSLSSRAVGDKLNGILIGG